MFHEETRWTRLDLDYKFILTPDAGYSIVGFKDLPDYVETSESNGTWTLQLPADRPQGRIRIAPDIIARTMGDNPGGAEATLQISRHMQKNQGILNNYDTLDLNQGTVVNYQGALVKTNEGDVYNMGGRVENNSGTVYSPFSVHMEYGSAGIRYGSGFQNWRGDCWLAQGQAATVEIYPPIGYSVYGFDLPDYMTLAEGNGVRTLQIAAEHPAKAEEMPGRSSSS